MMDRRSTALQGIGIGLIAVGLALPAMAQDEDLGTLVREGGQLFEANCSACHGSDGKGTGAAPALDGNAFVESRTAVINQILWGSSEHGMPAFVDLLTDREIAAIATFVRNAWSNDYGIVFSRSVELRR